MSCPVTVRLGVYALGASDAAESLLVESHVSDCQECRTELAQLEPLPRLLARVPAELVRGEPARKPADRRRSVLGLAAAAAAVLFAAGGIWLAQPGATQPGATQPGGTAQRTAVTVSGANAVTHVRMTAKLTRTSWGTRIRLTARGLPLNQPCRLIVRSRSGATEIAGYWDAWRAGPVTVSASAGWRPADIASLQVATPSKTLVTVRS